MSRAASSNDTCGNEHEDFTSALGIILSRSHPPPSKKVIHRRNPRILQGASENFQVRAGALVRAGWSLKGGYEITRDRNNHIASYYI